MKFEDTPNPNAKKIVVDHPFEVGIYLEDTKTDEVFIINLLNNPNVKSIFTGPNFLTIPKNESANWNDIIVDLENNN